MSRSRNYTFTLNNYTSEEYAALLQTKCNYLIMGKEIGSVEGTPHIQGYIVFAEGKTLSAVSKLMPRAHIEESKGSPDQNYEYCSKDKDFIEVGRRPMSQKRKGQCNIERFETAYELAKEGNFEEIPKDILLRYYPTLKKIAAEHQKPPPCLDEITNIWYYGPAGTGKTTKAKEIAPNAYLKGLTKWWDGYDGQQDVIIDDMDPFHKGLAHEFKQWGHHYPFPAETKGGQITIRPKRIIVTSQYRIHEIWDDPESVQAMQRRYEEILVSTNKPMTDTKLIL